MYQLLSLRVSAYRQDQKFCRRHPFGTSSTLIQFISPFGPATKPSSDMSINEIIFFLVYFKLFVKVNLASDLLEIRTNLIVELFQSNNFFCSFFSLSNESEKYLLSSVGYPRSETCSVKSSFFHFSITGRYVFT